MRRDAGAYTGRGADGCIRAPVDGCEALGADGAARRHAGIGRQRQVRTCVEGSTGAPCKGLTALDNWPIRVLTRPLPRYLQLHRVHRYLRVVAPLRSDSIAPVGVRADRTSIVLCPRRVVGGNWSACVQESRRPLPLAPAGHSCGEYRDA